MNDVGNEGTDGTPKKRLVFGKERQERFLENYRGLGSVAGAARATGIGRRDSI